MKFFSPKLCLNNLRENRIRVESIIKEMILSSSEAHDFGDKALFMRLLSWIIFLKNILLFTFILTKKGHPHQGMTTKFITQDRLSQPTSSP